MPRLSIGKSTRRGGFLTSFRIEKLKLAWRLFAPELPLLIGRLAFKDGWAALAVASNKIAPPVSTQQSNLAVTRKTLGPPHPEADVDTTPETSVLRRWQACALVHRV